MEEFSKTVQRIKDVVEETLREDERAKNNDHWLIIQVLKKMGFKVYIDYHELDSMPSFETITRCRRHFQNTKGEFVPTKETDSLRNKRKEENMLIWRNSHLQW